MVLLVDEGRRWQRQRLVSYRDMIDAVLLWDQCVLMSDLLIFPPICCRSTFTVFVNETISSYTNTLGSG